MENSICHLKESQSLILIKKACLAHCGVLLAEGDKSWALHKVCNSCVTRLCDWSEGEQSLNFRVPMIWQKPASHVDDCYFFW